MLHAERIAESSAVGAVIRSRGLELSGSQVCSLLSRSHLFRQIVKVALELGRVET